MKYDTIKDNINLNSEFTTEFTEVTEKTKKFKHVNLCASVCSVVNCFLAGKIMDFKRKNHLRFVLLLTWGLIFFISLHLEASLTNYANSVKKETVKNKTEDTSASNQTVSGPSENTCVCGGCIRPMFNLIGSIAAQLWAINNLSVAYLSAPYVSSQTDFIYHETIEEGEGIPSTHGKHGYILAGGGYVYAPQFQSQGGNIFVRGHFWKFFGPEIDCRMLTDGKNYLGYYALGINLALFQHSFLSADLYIQYAIMTGLLDMKGIAYGAVFQSFPVRPLFIIIRTGGQSYPGIGFFDAEARLGVFWGNLGISGGYRCQISDDTFMGNILAGIMVCF